MQGINANNKKIYISALTGLFMGMLFIFLPLKIFLLVTGGIILTILIFWKAKIGIFTAVGFAPFIPTLALAGITILSLFSLFIKRVIKGEKIVKLDYTDIFLLLFSIIILYGTVISYAIASSAKISLIFIVFISAYYILKNTANSKQMIYALIVLMIISSFIVALYGIYQNFAGIDTTKSWIDEEMFEDVKIRVYSFFDNPNVLGEYLIIMIPISFALFWSTTRKFYKFLFGIITLSLFPCLIFTLSRGSWLGVGIALAVFALMRDKRLVALGIVLIAVSPLFLPDSVIFRLQSIGNVEDTSTAYRLSIWIGSLKLIKDYWLTGIGIGSGAFSTIYPIYALSGAAYALHAHNLYLQLFVETGIVGLIVFAIIIFMFYKNVLSGFHKTNDLFLSTLLVALCSSMTGYLFQGLVDNIWYNYRIVYIFWSIYALGIIASKVAIKEGELNDKGVTNY